MRIAITGANGFLGTHLVNLFRLNGVEVISMVRSPKDRNDVEFSLQDFSSKSEIFVDLNISVLVHCAWDLSLKGSCESYDTNVTNSIKLFRSAKDAGVIKFVFISSMSSYSGCQSTYGNQKLEVEKYVLSLGGIVIRPGLIWGEKSSGGMFSTLNKLARRLPIIPLIGAGKNFLFLSHIDDLSNLVFRLITRIDNSDGLLITAAATQPVSFKRILQVCCQRNHKKAFFFPIPTSIIYCFLRICELLNIPIPLRSDSVTGLIKSDTSPKFDSIIYKKIGFSGFRFFDV